MTTLPISDYQAGPNPRLPVQVRQVRPQDYSAIASWVTTKHQLQMISGEVASRLTTKIIDRWTGDSVDALVLTCRDHPVAFCTLSATEYSLPDAHVEACHLVVHPHHRRRYFGTALLAHARVIAAQHSFLRLVGRVVKGNDGAVCFTHYTHWNVLESGEFDSNFHWYSFELRR